MQAINTTIPERRFMWTTSPTTSVAGQFERRAESRPPLLISTRNGRFEPTGPSREHSTKTTPRPAKTLKVLAKGPRHIGDPQWIGPRERCPNLTTLGDQPFPLAVMPHIIIPEGHALGLETPSTTPGRPGKRAPTGDHFRLAIRGGPSGNRILVQVFQRPQSAYSGPTIVYQRSHHAEAAPIRGRLSTMHFPF